MGYLAFAIYEVMVHVLGLDLKGFFSEFLLFTPLISLLIGFIPGCGPQILVTALYLSGYIPMSALISNAISNDGDALFPAIALFQSCFSCDCLFRYSSSYCRLCVVFLN